MHNPVYLVMVNIADEVWSYRIHAERRTVGRSLRATIRVPSHFDTISRFHAEIWYERAGIHLNDLGSQGGTRVNGIWLTKGQPVKVMIGDSITLSESEFKVVEHVSALAELLDEVNIHPDLIEDDSAATAIFGMREEQDFVRRQLSQLTPSELHVVLWMYRGYTNDVDLGRMLHRSPHTVRTQMASIFDKLGVNSRTEIVTWLKRVVVLPRRSTEETTRVGYRTRTW